MSPATACGTCLCFLPSSFRRWPRRSLPSRYVLMHVQVAARLPGDDAQHGELAGERVDDRLEDEGGERRRGVGGALDPVAGLRVVALPRRQVGGRRQQVDDRRRAAGGARSLAPAPQRIGRNFPPACPRAAPPQLVAATARCPRGTSRGARRWPRRSSRRAARAPRLRRRRGRPARPPPSSSPSRPGRRRRAAAEDVDDAVELGLRADRHLEHGRAWRRAASGPRARGRDAGALAVEAGDEADRRETELPAPAPHLLGLDLHLAARRAEHQDDARGRRPGSSACRAGRPSSRACRSGSPRASSR